MKKYFWFLEKSKQFLLSKKPDMKLSKNFSEQLNNYQIHLHKLFPNRKRSINWSEENIKDNDELLMRNTYINDVELAKKKNLVSESKIKNSERHVGWADDNKNENNEKKLVNYDIENDLFFKKKVKDITSHLNITKELKCIIKKVENEDKSDNNNNNKNELCLEESVKDDKMEFFDTKNILKNKVEKGDNNNEDILTKINKDNEQLKENNQKLGNKKEEENKISLDNELSKSDNKMKLNIFKNLEQKEPLSNSNNFPINLPLKDFNKTGKENSMNVNFNNINFSDANKKYYYNNFISNENNKIFKNNNNIYPIYLKPNKSQKKSRSTSKTNHKNMIPFIEYNQNNNIIMINNSPPIINDNQKFFVKFNKDNNMINGNNQFIQNNNFININYYPQSNESKF